MNDRQYCSLDRPIFCDTGQKRRVGFELEFSGLELESVAQTLADVLEGKVVPKTKAECLVESKDLGTFKIELDWQLGKRMARQREEDRDSQGDDPLMSMLASVASEVVPVEVVCPPIDADRLEALNPVVEALRDAGAIGTSASLVYAFGVHINPELPDTKAVTIAGYLKAFSLAQEWLVDQHSVDLSRRITPYIDLFPASYVREVLDYDENVTLEQLIDDYVVHNPTRNRALDMTPLFRHLDEDRLVSAIDDERINARPTFHYRLPNSHLGEDGWYLNRSWNLWCVIERLSQDSAMMDEISQAWKARDDQLITLEGYAWHKQLSDILNDLLSA